MSTDVAASHRGTAAERRRKTTVCVSCPACAGAVPIRACSVDGEVEPVLECRTCGWIRSARREDR